MSISCSRAGLEHSEIRAEVATKKQKIRKNPNFVIMFLKRRLPDIAAYGLPLLASLQAYRFAPTFLISKLEDPSAFLTLIVR